MVLLGGDLFHDNKPSKLTLYRTMSLLRQYTPTRSLATLDATMDQIRMDGKFSVQEAHPLRNGISKPAIEFIPEKGRFPVFTIHGNHDDPCGDGPLSAIDLLQVSDFIHYFGKSPVVNQIEVFPVQIIKGNTKLALFGLGHVRDERLNRLFEQHKVKFMDPGETNDIDLQAPSVGYSSVKIEPNVAQLEQELDRLKRELYEPSQGDGGMNQSLSSSHPWFKLFVLHQNRYERAGSRNFIPESYLTDFDLIIWGHEHECRIEPEFNNYTHIMQPGSSIATSLSQSETIQKQIALLEIVGDHFRVTPYPLKTVRPFIMQQICLMHEPHILSAHERGEDIETTISNHLTQCVETILDELEKSVSNGNGKVAKIETLEGDQQEILEQGVDEEEFGSSSNKHVQKPLVRLKVDYTGFTIINSARFCKQFVSRIANPDDMLVFHRSKRKSSSSHGERSIQDSEWMLCEMERGVHEKMAGQDLDGFGAPSIERLIDIYLNQQSLKKLQILSVTQFTKIIHQFVQKDEKGIIINYLNNYLKQMQIALSNKKDLHQIGFKHAIAEIVEHGLKIPVKEEGEGSDEMAALESVEKSKWQQNNLTNGLNLDDNMASISLDSFQVTMAGENQRWSPVKQHDVLSNKATTSNHENHLSTLEVDTEMGNNEQWRPSTDYSTSGSTGSAHSSPMARSKSNASKRSTQGKKTSNLSNKRTKANQPDIIPSDRSLLFIDRLTQGTRSEYGSDSVEIETNPFHGARSSPEQSRLVNQSNQASPRSTKTRSPGNNMHLRSSQVRPLYTNSNTEDIIELIDSDDEMNDCFSSHQGEYQPISQVVSKSPKEMQLAGSEMTSAMKRFIVPSASKWAHK